MAGGDRLPHLLAAPSITPSDTEQHMRIPVPVTDIDDASTLRKRWLFWARIPAPTQDAMRERERALHAAYVAAKADRLRHAWLYGFNDE